MSGPSQSAAPDISIRARPPSPRRLSRRVLLAGALSAGAVIALALVNGLAERPRRYAEQAAPAASASAPETIAGASDQYTPETLEPPRPLFETAPQEEALAPPFEGERARQVSRDESAAPSQSAAPLLYDLDGRRGADGREGAQLIAPLSRYELKAGHIIHAALITALNSDAPGQVIAQVSAPVFDTVTGRHLLIPQGARLIGAYQSGARYGDRRLRLVWNRLVLPNGYSLDLGGMDGTDAQGAAGVSDSTDNHLDRLAVAIGLSALISVAANEAEESGDDEDRLGPSLGDAAAQQAAATGSRIVERDLAVHPTLRVRAGASVRVLVTRDLVLRPYRSGE